MIPVDSNIQRLKKQSVSNIDRQRIIEKTLEGFSVTVIASMYQKKIPNCSQYSKEILKNRTNFLEKRGGDKRSKLSNNIKECLLTYVNEKCTKTLKEMAEWIRSTFSIDVSISTIDRTLRKFHYTLKRITLLPERRNCQRTIDLRAVYAANYRSIEVNNDDKNFIFLDEVGFAVVTRPSRGRSRQGVSAYVSVPAARSRNISVIAAMNKYGMIYHTIQERAVNGEDFKHHLKVINERCLSFGIQNPIFVMDNARIHHYKGLNEDEEVSLYNIKYLPPYSPFLNPIENVFSIWKNSVIRGEALTEAQLRVLIVEKFNDITPENCSSFYRKMLGYLQRAENCQVIFE